MLSARSVAVKLKDGEWAYALGRFRTVRRVYSWRRSKHAPVVPHPNRPGVTLFRELGVEQSINGLTRDAYAPGLSLPSTVAAGLHDFAQSAELRAHKRDHVRFRHGDVVDGYVGQEPIVIGTVVEPQAAAYVKQIAEDPTVRGVVAGYLGYEPTSCTPWMFWSYAADYTEMERRAAGQTFEYHYDVYGYNFMYVNFYLSAVGPDSGAHKLVAGSHRRKPLSRLLNSAIASDEQVVSIYGESSIRTVTGAAGSGFFEDTSCYHLATPPITGDRLMLQYRFS